MFLLQKSSAYVLECRPRGGGGGNQTPVELLHLRELQMQEQGKGGGLFPENLDYWQDRRGLGGGDF